MVVVKRIGVWSVAKLEAVLMAIMGLIFGVIYFVMSLIIGALGLGNGDAASFGLLAGLGVLGIIFLPIFYGLLGLVMGALSAWLYNVIAGWIGGIEIEFVK